MSQRQLFYIELKPGETTIVSWKKLLREGKIIDQCPSTSTTDTVMESTPYGTHCSAHETPKRAQEDNSEVGQCCDPFVRNARLDHQSTLSSYHQLRKRSVELIEVEGKKNDHPSIEHVRLEDTSSWYSAKTSLLLDQPFTQSIVPTAVKDHHCSLPQSSEVYAPLVVYKKKLATFSSKSNYASHVNEMGTAPILPLKSKRSGLQKTEKFSSGKSRIKGGCLGDPSDVMCQTSAGNCIPLQTNPRCKKLMKENDIEVSFRNQCSGKGHKSGELLDVDSPAYNHSLQHSVSTYAAVAVNGAKPAKPLSTVLERVIRELEGAVAESKSFKIEASEAHTSWLTFERELPLEVTLKLGEVARLVQSSREGMSEELVSRLVSIVGKLVHGKTLKRLLRKFVMLKLSVKKEKGEKFKVIKNEILAMISYQQGGAANCAEVKEGAILGETYKLDSDMEDKLCDLYDLCVQGFSGEKGVESQKWFIELGDLWPEGVMDHHKLRDAIIRAKSRRRVLVDKDQGQKSVMNDAAGSPMAIDRTKTSSLVPSRKRKATSGDSCYPTSPSSCRTFPMNAMDHSVVHPRTSDSLPKSAKQHSFPSERQPESSVAHSSVSVGQQKQHIREKKQLKLRFSLEPADGSHRYKEQTAVKKFNCSRGDAHLSCRPSSFPA